MGFPDLISIVPWATGLNVLAEELLEIRDTCKHRLQVLDALRVDRAHLIPEILKSKSQAVVDNPHDDPPGVQAVEVLSAVIQRQGRARREACAKEPPYLGVKHLLPWPVLQGECPV